jgi:adenylate kinase family enzyme
MINLVLNRILIIGDSGRGKTFLASKLSEKLGIPYYSTDDFYYEIKFTKPRDKQESIDNISKIYHKEKWIVEGTTHHLIKSGLDSADIIIYLKYNNIFFQLFSIIKRHFTRKDASFYQTLLHIRHVIHKRFQTKADRQKMGQMTTSERIKPYKQKVITLTSFKEIDCFVNFIK